MASNETLTMSPGERNRAVILVVESDGEQRGQIRTILRNLGYSNVADAPNHSVGIERFNDRKFTHVIFEAKKTNMPTKEFLEKVFAIDSTIVALPASFEPNVDDVFDLLVLGARGYLVKPYTSDSVEIGMLQATKGEPMADAVLQAKDRNEALVAILMGSLDKAATVMRQAYQFETAKREIPRAISGLRRSAELARTFCKGGNDGLLDALEKFCIERSKGPATRLGRLRKRLNTTRVAGEDDTPEPPNPTSRG